MIQGGGFERHPVYGPCPSSEPRQIHQPQPWRSTLRCWPSVGIFRLPIPWLASSKRPLNWPGRPVYTTPSASRNDTGEFLAEFITTGISDEDAVRISHRPRGHGILGLCCAGGQTLVCAIEVPPAFGRLRPIIPRDVQFPDPARTETARLGNYTSRVQADGRRVQRRRSADHRIAGRPMPGVAIENPPVRGLCRR